MYQKIKNFWAIFTSRVDFEIKWDGGGGGGGEQSWPSEEAHKGGKFEISLY